MRKYFLLLLIFFVICNGMNAQDEKQRLIKEADSIYQANIKKTRIYGVYIPKDIEEAFLELDRLSPPESLAKIKMASEETVAKKLHFGLGRWMSHNWNFTEGSRFSHHLKNLGLFYTEDMIDFMLISYHRYLNKRDQDTQARINSYQLKRKKLEAEELSKGEVIIEKTVVKKN